MPQPVFIDLTSTFNISVVVVTVVNVMVDPNSWINIFFSFRFYKYLHQNWDTINEEQTVMPVDPMSLPVEPVELFSVITNFTSKLIPNFKNKRNSFVFQLVCFCRNFTVISLLACFALALGKGLPKQTRRTDPPCDIKDITRFYSAALCTYLSSGLEDWVVIPRGEKLAWV